MRLRFSFITLVIFALSSIVQSQTQQSTWSKYIPKNQRKEIVKKVSRNTGVGRVMTTGMAANVLWVTESLARALVSDAIDRERLTSEEADQKYLEFRPNESSYRVLINVFSTGLFARPRMASEVGNPMPQNEIFLQRADNRERFSKGIVSDKKFDIFLQSAGTGDVTAYLVELPKTNRAGEPIIKSLEDKIELQFTLPRKKTVFEYKLRELVSRIEDL